MPDGFNYGVLWGAGFFLVMLITLAIGSAIQYRDNHRNDSL